MNYVFNHITVNPQLPKRIERLSEIANNLWWSWNTEFLKLFKIIDLELWEKCAKNPVKFLKQVDQTKLEKKKKNTDFLSDYDEAPVDIHTFLHDKRYLGNALYDKGKFTVFPY